jgi:DNA-binding MarR family transcriptional regulator
MSDNKLEEIKNLLEDIKNILQIINQDKIDEAKTKLLEPGSVEEKIYKLCNGNNSAEDIAKSIKKDNKYTLTVLGKLRKKGLIKTIEKGDKKVHEQRF